MCIVWYFCEIFLRVSIKRTNTVSFTCFEVWRNWPQFLGPLYMYTHRQMHGERGTPVLFALKGTGVDSEWPLTFLAREKEVTRSGHKRRLGECMRAERQRRRDRMCAPTISCIRCWLGPVYKVRSLKQHPIEREWLNVSHWSDNISVICVYPYCLHSLQLQ